MRRYVFLQFLDKIPFAHTHHFATDPEALRLVANSSTAVADSFRQVSQVTRAAAQRADSLLFNVNLSSNDIALHWYRDKTRDHNSLKDLKSLTIVGVGHSLLAELLNFVGHRTPPNLKVLVVHDPHIWTHNLRMEPTIDLRQLSFLEGFFFLFI